VNAFPVVLVLSDMMGNTGPIIPSPLSIDNTKRFETLR
jgi:hypothetical protein